MERALGAETISLLRKQLDFWQRAGLDSLIEEWRHKQLARMFSLSEFVNFIKFRFTRWYNRKTGRKGGLWESRFSSTIVEEEERALRTMAAYIDLNPVRAGMVADPADYRWSGYAEAMAGKARAWRGLVRRWPGHGKLRREQNLGAGPFFRSWWSAGRWSFTGPFWADRGPPVPGRMAR